MAIMNLIEMQKMVADWKEQANNIWEKIQLMHNDFAAIEKKVIVAEGAIDKLLEVFEGASSEPEQSNPEPPKSEQPPVKRIELNTDIQVSRWGFGEVEDTIMLILRREKAWMRPSELVTAMTLNRGKKTHLVSVANAAKKLHRQGKLLHKNMNGHPYYAGASEGQ